MIDRAIIVPLIGPRDDPDLISERSLPVARALATTPGDSVVLISVVDRSIREHLLRSDQSGPNPELDLQLADLRAYLDDVAATFHRCETRVVIRAGSPAAELVREIRGIANPLVIMASHGRFGMERMLLSSVASRVIHDVDCPAILVREPLANAYALHNLLIPLDGSAAAESALDRALEILAGLPVRLHLLHVVEPLINYYGFVAPGYSDAAHRWAAEYLGGVSQRLSGSGYEVGWSVRDGFVAEEIAEAAIEERVDLVVLSTEGRHAIRRILFGSVTERTLHEGVLPLLIVRPDVATL